MFKPDLLWIRYKEKYYFILHVGNDENKMKGLLSKEIPTNVAEIIRKNVKNKDIENNTEFIMFMKKNFNDVLNSAYREFHLDKVNIVESYSLGD